MCVLGYCLFRMRDRQLTSPPLASPDAVAPAAGASPTPPRAAGPSSTGQQLPGNCIGSVWVHERVHYPHHPLTPQRLFWPRSYTRFVLSPERAPRTVAEDANAAGHVSASLRPQPAEAISHLPGKAEAAATPQDRLTHPLLPPSAAHLPLLPSFSPLPCVYAPRTRIHTHAVTFPACMLCSRLQLEPVLMLLALLYRCRHRQRELRPRQVAPRLLDHSHASFAPLPSMLTAPQLPFIVLRRWWRCASCTWMRCRRPVYAAARTG